VLVADHDLSRRQELGAFLRAQRARLTPMSVGLPDGGRRRAPGLRREEVAELSGVGVSWYTWLEQGRKIMPTAQVIDALARALRLESAAHRHLRRLAALPSPDSGDPVMPTEAMPALRRMLAGLEPACAFVADAHFDYVAWNNAYAVTCCDPARVPPARRNVVLLFLTDPAVREMVRPWREMARSLLAQLRALAGNHPTDPRFIELIELMTDASPEFREWWPEYPVEESTSRAKEIHHPVVGRIRMDLTQTRLLEHPDLMLVLQTPVTDADHERLRRLREPNGEPNGEPIGEPGRAAHNDTVDTAPAGSG
jgi:hypothetical protein